MPSDRLRRRDSILAAMERFRSHDPGVTVNAVICFLYVCENEGVSVTELASVSSLRLSTASRVIRGLGGSRSGRGERGSGLVEVRSQGPNRKSRTLFLTEAGARLRWEIDEIIREAVPITPPSAGQAPRNT